MKLNKLRPAKGATKKRKRLGAGTGTGRGGTCGRGHKGHKSRSGGNTPAWFEGGQMPLQRRLPKRGFTNIFRKEHQVVNVGMLNRFDAESEIDPGLLRQEGVIRRSLPVKLLGNGTVDRPLVVRVHAASASAR
ncbi:MAG: 50S ribosomal protein L15, partial [Candidatus Eisenbacteria bacterium]|nr:50S ribosomal protein L15 [Candidatus Latescibacterota bacterium]MBD3301972.1 50S ribosomal protein L15 [Candidatus Eisenbacteria bacterium]